MIGLLSTPAAGSQTVPDAHPLKQPPNPPLGAAVATLPPSATDPVQFARRRLQLAGRAPLAAFARLAEADVAGIGDIDWSIRGETGPDELDRRREFLTVGLTFSPVMTCVRCLEPVTVGPLAVERRYRLAASERQAEIEDREAGEVDVIAATPEIDLAGLLEDEAILALPMAPAHEVCPALPRET